MDCAQKYSFVTNKNAEENLRLGCGGSNAVEQNACETECLTF